MNRRSLKIVFLTGAGFSAPSGLATFRDPNGIWSKFKIEEVATPEAWANDPEKVLQFYNERRSQLASAQPNAAHFAVAELERQYDVVVVTQNIDDLHERAGSSQVIHLHGELTKARSSTHPSLIHEIGSRPILLGDRCGKGGQLRPHIVWFGEEILRFDEAVEQVETADMIVVAGTSLTVYPAAGLAHYARAGAEKFLVNLEIDDEPHGFNLLKGSVDEIVPELAKRLLETNGS